MLAECVIEGCSRIAHWTPCYLSRSLSLPLAGAGLDFAHKNRALENSFLGFASPDLDFCLLLSRQYSLHAHNKLGKWSSAITWLKRQTKNRSIRFGSIIFLMLLEFCTSWSLEYDDRGDRTFVGSILIDGFCVAAATGSSAKIRLCASSTLNSHEHTEIGKDKEAV